MKEQIYAMLDKFVAIEDDFSHYKKELITDYITALLSREVSYICRKEVLTGKAKFGISGDGKELPQLAMARAFEPGDWKAGYYRDQTFMFAKNLSTVREYFAQLYADQANDPFSGGRQMVCHFATPTIDRDGNFKDLASEYNVSSDVSCTAGQVARGIGHAFASKVFRSLDNRKFDKLSNNGNEVTFFTIGDGSTSEGPFLEMVNAAGVLDIPLVISIWDDGYAISVPVEFQTTKSSISKALEGFLIDEKGRGLHIYVAKAWDYQELCLVYKKAAKIAREQHKAVIIHVQECTQPQGHSTSGSHERYKTKERLLWEQENDCIGKMEEWMLSNAILNHDEIAELKSSAKEYAKTEAKKAWNDYYEPVQIAYNTHLQEITNLTVKYPTITKLKEEYQIVKKMINPFMSELTASAKRVQFVLRSYGIKEDYINNFINITSISADLHYHTKLYSDTPKAAINVMPVKAKYADDAPIATGYQIINQFFDSAFAKHDNLIAFGEDLGKIGDVNQGFVGLQEKYGSHRIMDTGIREWTLIGQALGSAMRGLKPIVEIQYLDYLAYAFSPMSDDLATLRYRTNGIQVSPMIVRTRGHRLEGIWHSGSPMGMITSSMRGVYLCVPRNFVQAAGMYNTLLKSDDPGIVVECLNAYRLKESVPENLADITIPLGVPEILHQGSDITLVTYGACVRVCEEAIKLANENKISVELIDVQTLMPFDLEGIIVESIKKTNKILFVDEDVPGGATAYLMQQVLQGHNGYKYLDASPVCLSASDHRPPYSTDGDYFTKPNTESVFEAIYQIMSDYNPSKYPM
jgi:pyruvate/2-oxoglutarate/acetoin dehydrogenase E1 component/TPP-dependent pyruvate/acetoin dehydrogenase alpha subunit